MGYPGWLVGASSLHAVVGKVIYYLFCQTVLFGGGSSSVDELRHSRDESSGHGGLVGFRHCISFFFPIAPSASAQNLKVPYLSLPFHPAALLIPL